MNFDKDGFMRWLKETLNFELCAQQITVELILNLLEYAEKNNNHSKNQMAYFLSDIIPDVSVENIARFERKELDREKQKIYEGDIIEFRAENGNDYFAVIKYGEYEQGSSGTTNVGFYAETLKPCLELFACAEITSDFRQQSVSQIACRCRVVAKSSEWEG